jgi:hypothetical protein
MGTHDSQIRSIPLSEFWTLLFCRKAVPVAKEPAPFWKCGFRDALRWLPLLPQILFLVLIASICLPLEYDTSAGVGAPQVKADVIRTAPVFVNEGRAYQVELERVQLRPNCPVWQFSSNSVGLIPQLYKLVGESAFERRLPEPLVRWTLLETAVWCWLALILLATREVLAPTSKVDFRQGANIRNSCHVDWCRRRISNAGKQRSTGYLDWVPPRDGFNRANHE